MTDILKAIGALRLVPVIVINEEENAYPLAQALKAGDCPAPRSPSAPRPPPGP